MAVLLFAVELEILTELDAPDRGAFLKEAAAAYRARAKCLRTGGKTQLAKNDEKRAGELEGKAKLLAQDGNRSERSTGDAITSRAGRADKPGDSPGAGASRQAEEPPASKPNAPKGEIQLVNDWTGAVTVLIDGTSYRLPAGQQRTISRAAGVFTYEVEEARHRASGTVEAGKVYRIRIGRREE